VKLESSGYCVRRGAGRQTCRLVTSTGIVNDTKVDGDPTIGSVWKHNQGAAK
jgi:hypothetical protein